MPIVQPQEVRERNVFRYLVFNIDVTFKQETINIGDVVV